MLSAVKWSLAVAEPGRQRTGTAVDRTHQTTRHASKDAAAFKWLRLVCVLAAMWNGNRITLRLPR